jgi:hypothetical protein
MTKIRFLVLASTLLLAGVVASQLSVSVHTGTSPSWGPAGYNEVRYYYLPEIETYYDVQTSRFIYLSGNRWVHRASLPPRYRHYNLRNGYKVVIQNYHGQAPYQHFKAHRAKYGKKYRGEEQQRNGYRNNQDHNRMKTSPTGSEHPMNKASQQNQNSTTTSPSSVRTHNRPSKQSNQNHSPGNIRNQKGGNYQQKDQQKGNRK